MTQATDDLGADPAKAPRLARLSGDVPTSGESFHELAVVGGARVEHIVSPSTPDPRMQAQAWDEWVLVLSGAAELEVSGELVEMTDGEWLLLPAGTPHRVLSTRAGTQWIAVHALVQPAQEA